MVAVEIVRSEQRPEASPINPRDETVLIEPAGKRPRRKILRNTLRKIAAVAAIGGLGTAAGAMGYTGIQIIRVGGQETGINFSPQRGSAKFAEGIMDTEDKIAKGIMGIELGAGSMLTGAIIYEVLRRKEELEQAELDSTPQTEITTA